MTCKLIFLFKDSHSDFPVANLLFGDTFWVRVGHVMNLAMGTERIYMYHKRNCTCLFIPWIGLMKRKQSFVPLTSYPTSPLQPAIHRSSPNFPMKNSMVVDETSYQQDKRTFPLSCYPLWYKCPTIYHSGFFFSETVLIKRKIESVTISN